MPVRTKEALRELVRKAVLAAPVTDTCTRLRPQASVYPVPWGIDDLLTSRALREEAVRVLPGGRSEELSVMPQPQAAEFLWQTLFVDRTPLSLSCQGILRTLNALGVESQARGLPDYRAAARGMSATDYLDLVFRLSGVKTACVLCDPLAGGDEEAWTDLGRPDPRFLPVLSVDTLLNDWRTARECLRERDYTVEDTLTAGTMDAIRSYLRYSIVKLNPVYLAAALPRGMDGGEDAGELRVLHECILPVADEAGIPFGADLSGGMRVPRACGESDAWAPSTLAPLLGLCQRHPRQRFLGLSAAAALTVPELRGVRETPNLHLIGCTAPGGAAAAAPLHLCLDQLGGSVTPLYSEAGAVDELLPSWDRGRSLLGTVLFERYAELSEAGWTVTAEDVERDAAELLGGAFWRFLGRPNPAAGL
ncbi:MULTISPECIES: hypothetical protein [Paenibacillus]|uniref:hypothetical protein n=1 Tax=Paenibacillus TaxID=44249 RepID=UPI0022B8FEB4|nr:hypothetical protein [Paenibacillus caseinilyticus]MCZ8520722.1 hypothetical protein [Paenibacillus caseinilyticus]